MNTHPLTPEALLQRLEKQFPRQILKSDAPWETKGAQLTLRTPPEKTFSIIQYLKDICEFEFLDFITAVDWKGPVDPCGYVSDPNPNPFRSGNEETSQGPPHQYPPAGKGPYREKFEVVYCLSSWKNRLKVVLKTEIPRSHSVLFSLVPIWKAADWQEREIYDLMGIEFMGHPNLKKILTPDFIQGHPLRKDYVHQRDKYD